MTDVLLADPQKAADDACRELLSSGSTFSAQGALQLLERHARDASTRGGVVPGMNSPGVATSNSPLFVKIRGMVQDQSDSDALRLLSVRDGVCDLFETEGEECGEGVRDYLNVVELYLVPVPGEAPWVCGEDADFRPGGAAQRRGQVRSREGDVITERKPCEGGTARVEGFIDETLNCPATGGRQTTAPRQGFVVEMFGEFDAAPQLNSIVEVYGVLHPLQLGGEEGTNAMEEDGVEDCEEKAAQRRKTEAQTEAKNQGPELWDPDCLSSNKFHKLPESLVRRFTGLYWRFAAAAPEKPVGGQELAAARGSLLQWLTQSCGGDGLVAELVMLQMISVVSQRSPVVTGTLPLSISGATPAFVASLARAARVVCERSVVWGMRRECLNDDAWVPCRKGDGEMLSAGRLQLPQGTLMMLDETGLSAGPVTGAGVENLQAISKMCMDQQVLYQFPYAEVPFNTDLPVIVLTQTGASILSSVGGVGLQCPLNATSDGVWEQPALPGAWRDYIMQCRAASCPTVDGGLRESFLGDLTQASRDFPSAFSSSSVITEHSSHQFLTVATNVARSMCAAAVGDAEWKHALSLGREILRRRASNPQPPQAP
eukprot:Hpha_TRINITY_DN16479_c4_g5::TRINITY_DN16479_c4_g5_i1::g.161080::m.161080